MATEFRECAGMAQFNTGTSKCLLDPGKVKAIILTMHGYKLPANATAELLEAACHDDRPNRIFPIKTIIEYAPSGGEANKRQSDMVLTRLHRIPQRMMFGQWMNMMPV